jgi:hypothetical protein
MLPAKQQQTIDKMVKFGWVPDKNNYYVNDGQDGLGIIFRHISNVAIVYPDGSIDRAGDQPHSKHLLKPRKDWYSPLEKRRAEQRTARWLDRFHKFVLDNEQALFRFVNS